MVQVHYLRQLLDDCEKLYQGIATELGRGCRFVGRLNGAHNSPEFSLIDGTLPGVAGKLIGREPELAALQAHMLRHRRVTVTVRRHGKPTKGRAPRSPHARPSHRSSGG